MGEPRLRPTASLRRSRAGEWLLVPLFALPCLVAAGAVLGFRALWTATIEGYAQDPVGAVRNWVAAQPSWRTGDWLSREDAETGERDWVRFRRGEMTGVVVRAGATLADPEWVLGTSFGAGLTPEALADAGVRLGIESGAPIGGHAGADPTTRLVASMHAAPAGDALRSAPLRAGTKLHLLLRDAAADPADVAALRALRDLEHALDDAGGALAPGGHLAGSTRILSAGGACRVVPSPSEGRPLSWRLTFTFFRDPTGTARLRWTPWDAPPSDTPVWTGRLQAPVPGVYTIDLPEGRAWWNDSAFRTWMPGIAAACAAFLAIPAALWVALRRRRRLDEARSRFVNEIAHDLRTPVAALRLHADLLADGRVPPADHAKHASILGREAARVAALLANLLDVSRLERGAAQYARETVDVAAAARDAARDVALLHPQRAADLTSEVPDGLAATADRTALARVLVNLLDNAAKFTSAGTAVRVRGASSGGRVRIVVEDEGPGIQPGERSRVFRPYERGSAATATAAPGTGLGLALVRELVRGMGGTVRLADRAAGADGAGAAGAARGAVFEIDLPGATDVGTD